MRNYHIDIFCGEKFYATMHLRYPATWVFSGQELVDEVHSRFPELRNSKWHF